MQSAKDSFFLALRERLAEVNPERTVVIDGQVRPGILVYENETEGVSGFVSDVFCIEFRDVQQVAYVAQAPMRMTCAITYRTKGGGDSSGLGRGRALAKMDAELCALLAAGVTRKFDHSVVPIADLGTMVFWGQPTFEAMTFDGEAVKRTARVSVYFHAEAGA